LTRPTVLVLGANGRFGAAAVQAFAHAGWRVLAQRRRTPAEPLPQGAQALHIALTETAALAAGATGARVVVHALNPLYTRWDTEALPLARLGMDLAEHLGARFMLPGNVYNFGQGMPALLREDTPQRPDRAKGRLRCALETEIRERCDQGRMQAAVLRAGDFYGAGRGSWFDQVIVKSIAAGRLVYPGPLDVPHAWAYLPDLARAFVALASRGADPAAPVFETLHFAGHTLRGAELLGAIESAATGLGLRPNRGFEIGTMPWALIRAGGLVYPMWRELWRMSYLWRVPHALDGAALERAVGPLPATPLAAAMRQALLDLGLAAPVALAPGRA
jgi:nucleoside-diphosphate-sugar epimerase